VVDLSVFDSCNTMLVLFWKNLFVGDGLDGGVVVVLMYLTVDYGLSLIMLCALNLLVGDCGIDSL